MLTICRYSVIDDYTEINTRASTKAQMVNYAASILASSTPMYNSTASTLTTSESIASPSTFSSPSVTIQPFVVGSYIPSANTTTATMHIFPSTVTNGNVGSSTYNNVANANMNSVSSSVGGGGTGGAGGNTFTYSSSTSTSPGVTSSTNGIGGSSSITETTTTTTNATPTKPASRKGSVIFPSVKNKPSVVNTTFTTDILTLKDVKVSIKL